MKSDNPSFFPVSDGRWDAVHFFRTLTERNRLARRHGFRFFTVSGLQGFEDAVAALQQANAFICVSDESDGMMEMENTPHIRQVKTVFMGMRHSVQTEETGELRRRCYEVMRELFRQMMSVMAKERTYIAQGGIYLDPNVQFSEINRYFAPGCACAYFQLAVVGYSDLRYNPEEWQ